MWDLGYSTNRNSSCTSNRDSQRTPNRASASCRRVTLSPAVKPSVSRMSSSASEKVLARCDRHVQHVRKVGQTPTDLGGTWDLRARLSQPPLMLAQTPPPTSGPRRGWAQLASKYQDIWPIPAPSLLQSVCQSVDRSYVDGGDISKPVSVK